MSTKNTSNSSLASTKNEKKNFHSEFELIKKVDSFYELKHVKNNLQVLYKHIPNTGVITTNITYLVGAIDENRGETGIAHMLEHMMFKPTRFDRKRGFVESASMRFEKETGITLNANTWKDRTTYFFSYPVEHYSRALKIEAERMRGLVLVDEEFQPERANVLSEHDMYNGDPHFALGVALCSSAFFSHPYGHETIGYREDIESYTIEKLSAFYERFYCPNNATLTVIGDILLPEALDAIHTHFGAIRPRIVPATRYTVREPKPEGLRRIVIKRPSTTNILSYAVRHPGFPTKDWYSTLICLKVLAEGKESILHTALVDTGFASDVTVMQEPTKDENVALVSITLANGTTHQTIEKKVHDILARIDLASLRTRVKHMKSQIISERAFEQDSSLKIAMEMTEYIASKSWESYVAEEKTIDSITPKDVLNAKKTLFDENRMVIGHFIGSLT